MCKEHAGLCVDHATSAVLLLSQFNRRVNTRGRRLNTCRHAPVDTDAVLLGTYVEIAQMETFLVMLEDEVAVVIAVQSVPMVM